MKFFQKDRVLFSQNMTANLTPNLTFGVVNKDSKSKENFTVNCGHNILRLFGILPNFSFTAYEMGKIISNKNGKCKLPN